MARSHTAPPNWYRDPTGHYEHRYWNGEEWTDRAASRARIVTDPMPTEGPYRAPTARSAYRPAHSRAADRVGHDSWFHRVRRGFGRA